MDGLHMLIGNLPAADYAYAKRFFMGQTSEVSAKGATRHGLALLASLALLAPLVPLTSDL